MPNSLKPRTTLPKRALHVDEFVMAPGDVPRLTLKQADGARLGIGDTFVVRKDRVEQIIVIASRDHSPAIERMALDRIIGAVFTR